MSQKSTALIPISLLIALLHAGCCLLPLVVAGVSSSFDLFISDRYKPMFTVLQIALIVYLAAQVMRINWSNSGSHSKTELWSYLTSFVIAIVGLVFGISEPLRTGDQKLATERFEYFRNHGQVVFNVEGRFDYTNILDDLQSIEGVKPSSVKIDGRSVLVSYRKDKTSKTVIFSTLKTMGYQVAFAE